MFKGERPAGTEVESRDTAINGVPVTAGEEVLGMTTSALRSEWQRLYRSSPHCRVSRDLLMLAIAWRHQELASSTRVTPTIRRLKKLAEVLEADGKLGEGRRVTLHPGARLLREWRGATHTVTVVADGFEWEGKRYGSLSEIAGAITGAHWSGPRFFGLTGRRLSSAAMEARDE